VGGHPYKAGRENKKIKRQMQTPASPAPQKDSLKIGGGRPENNLPLSQGYGGMKKAGLRNESPRFQLIVALRLPSHRRGKSRSESSNIVVQTAGGSSL